MVRPSTLPNDRILAGRVKNKSLRPVALKPEDIRLLDGQGDQVGASVVFLESYVHGLYPRAREPKRLPEEELRRTGRKAVIEPGKDVPLTVSWRERRGASHPSRIDYRAGSLPLPQP